MTKKGKSDANVANGELIDTLVILSGDLVQVVTKGVLLPADGVAGNMSGDRTEAVMGTISSNECSKNSVKKSSESTINKKKHGRKLNLAKELIPNSMGVQREPCTVDATPEILLAYLRWHITELVGGCTMKSQERKCKAIL